MYVTWLVSEWEVCWECVCLLLLHPICTSLGCEGVGVCRTAWLLGLQGLQGSFRALGCSFSRSLFKHADSVMLFLFGGVKGGQGSAGDTLTRDWERYAFNIYLNYDTMVKCLIRIKTKVNVHLRMINHCYRDVKVRVLALGPRLLGKALGALPILPSLPSSSTFSEASSRLDVSPDSTTGKACCWPTQA